MNRFTYLVAILACSLLLACVQKDQRIGRVNPSDPGGENYIQVKGNAPILDEPQNGAALSTIKPLMQWYSGIYSAFYSLLLDTVSVPVAIAKDSIADTFFVTPTSLSYGRTYYWSVIGHSSNGLSAASEIRSFTTPHIIVDSGLVAFFPFSGDAKDESGHGNRTTVSGASLTADRFGSANSAYLFDGVSNYIDVANTSQIAFSDIQGFSISFWVKTTSSKANMFPIMKFSTSSNGYGIVLNHAGSCAGPGIASFFVASGSPACAASPVNNDAWHHITGIYSGASNKVTLYVDGVVQATTGARSASVVVAADIIIGGSAGAYSFAGSIDDVRLYNRALTTDDIDSLYHEGGWTGP